MTDPQSIDNLLAANPLLHDAVSVLVSFASSHQGHDALAEWDRLRTESAERVIHMTREDQEALVQACASPQPVTPALARAMEKRRELMGLPPMTDLTRCPKCGGPADNGHDRCVPPSPYYCSKCEGQTDQMPPMPDWIPQTQWEHKFRAWGRELTRLLESEMAHSDKLAEAIDRLHYNRSCSDPDCCSQARAHEKAMDHAIAALASHRERRAKGVE